MAWTEDRNGAEMLYGYAPMRGDPKGVASARSEAMLFGSPLDPYGLRGRLLATLLIAFAFMLGTAMLGGIWLTSRALRPFGHITRTARSIGEGDLSRRIKLGTRDEIGQLSDGLDAMFDRLESAFERQRRFMIDAIHELRAPLSIIASESGRLLASGHDMEEYRRRLSTVQAECDYMAKLVEDLQTLAQVDSVGAAKVRKPVDLGAVAREVLEKFAPEAARRGLLLSAGNLPELRANGDRAELLIALSNLVDNAVKFGRPGGHVDVILEAADEHAIVRVVDDGPGMPPEKLARVFDRFFPGNEARPGGDGCPADNGLGLAIVKAIVEAHGGGVSVSNRPGSGLEFSISIPLA